jgi:hypothetical protein
MCAISQIAHHGLLSRRFGVGDAARPNGRALARRRIYFRDIIVV